MADDVQISDQDIEDTKKMYGIGTPAEPEAIHTDDELAETAKALGIRVSPSGGTPPFTGRLYISPRPSVAAQMTNQAVEGMPLIAPLVNKAVAAGGAVVQGIKGGYEPTFSERYEKNLEALRAENEQERKDYPKSSIAANIAGAGLVTAPLAMTPVGAGLLGMSGPTTGAQAIVGGATGGLIGASDAALRNEDPIRGGIAGGTGGFAGPVFGELAQKIATPTINYLWPRQGVLKDVNPIAINHLANALEGETPGSITAGVNRMGPQGFFGDITPRLTDIAGGLADTPGPWKTQVRSAYLDRASGQAQRIDQALTDAAGPKFSISGMRNMITEERASVADPLYQQFRDTTIAPTPEIRAVIPRLEKAGAFNLAEEIAGIEGKELNKNHFTYGPDKSFPTAETWGYVKQGLNRRIETAIESGDKTLSRSLLQLKKDMRTALNQSPGGQILQQADDAFASYSTLLDQLEAGRSTFAGGRAGLSADELKEELSHLSYPEFVARVAGMRQAAADAMGSTLNGDSKLRNLMLAPNNREKIKLMLPRSGDRLINTLEQEGFLAGQQSNVIGNIQTGASGAMRSERVNALKPQPSQQWNPSLTEPLSLIPPHIRESFRPTTILDAIKNQNAARANNDLANLITLRPGPRMNDLVQALQGETARRNAIAAQAARGGNALTAAMLPVSVAYRRNNP